MTTAVRQTPKARASSKAWWRPVALLSAVILILVLAWQFGLAEKLGGLRDWIEGLGPWGPAVFVLVYIAATVAAIPGSALTIVAGAIFGTVLGTIAVSVGSTVGAALCFLIARYFARNAVMESLGKSDKFRRLDGMTEEHGETIVAITRLVPLFPFNLLNYGFGLTRVRFWTYVFYSWLCMLPMTVIFVAGTDALVKLVREGKVEAPVIVAIAIMIVVLTLVIRSARRKLRSKESAAESASAPTAQQEGTHND